MKHQEQMQANGFYIPAPAEPVYTAEVADLLRRWEQDAQAWADAAGCFVDYKKVFSKKLFHVPTWRAMERYLAEEPKSAREETEQSEESLPFNSSSSGEESDESDFGLL